MNTKTPYYFFAAAVILLVLPAANMVLRIATATGSHDSFEQAPERYLAYFPAWLQNPKLITLINILMLALAGGLFYKSMTIRKLRLAGVVLGIMCILLLMWNVFLLV
jgi:hypothetical protein